MSKLNGETLMKITRILKIPEAQRDQQQAHFLSLNFKKNMICITNIINWWMLTKCIQNLQLHNEKTIVKENIDWLFVLKGSFDFHGMVYKQGEQLSIQAQNCEHLNFQQNSVYSVLTHQAKQKAKAQAQQLIRIDQKQFARRIIFPNDSIGQKNWNIFLQQVQQFRLKKGEIFIYDSISDMIFIVVSGSIKMNYEWRRLIKLRELGPGSIFSTFLGRYFYKTSQELKQMQKFQFQIVAEQQSTFLGFSPDIFYEKLKFMSYKSVVENAWKLYLKRVSEVKRIIQSIGMMKPQKQQVKLNIRQQIQAKFLRQKCVSVPVAIQRRKLRKITFQIFEERSVRKKTNYTIPSRIQSAREITSRSRTQAIENSKYETLQSTNYGKGTLSCKNHEDSLLCKSASVQLRKQRANSQKFIIDRNRTVSARVKTDTFSSFNNNAVFINNNQQNEQQNTSFYRFFRPEQFVSKKLKIHYQSVLMNAQTFKIPLYKNIDTQKQKHKNKKQYFQEYINERRVLKLGPKKRLLYKKRQGF